MCGIAGRIGSAGVRTVDDMVASMQHRGPDAGGVLTSGSCRIGMRRLRIVDLRPEADQPMTGDRGEVWLVFNGELYNHVELRSELQGLGHAFCSRSDTETIVHGYEEWGDDVVRRLRGMFAIALWDAPRQRLLLARDRLGIKPLYLLREGAEGLAFASEATALGVTDIDPSALVSLLRLGWVGHGRTVHRGVSELPPGHLLVHESGRSEVKEYWRPIWRDEAVEPDRVRAALTDSVQRHLEADVPVGIFLSAGVDSAVIASLAAGRADVRGYTVAFDVGPDEAPDAGRTAELLGLPQTVVQVSGSAVTSSMDHVVRSMDQPTVDGVNSFVISRAVREAGVTVALSGLGGDELFAGYSTFRRVPQLTTLGERVPLLPGLAGALHSSPRTRWSRWSRAVESAGIGGSPAAYAGVRGLLSWQALRDVWPASQDIPATDAELVDEHLGTSVSALELTNYLRYQLLRDTDVMSMAHSLEVRVPLLDDDVVDAALCLRPAANGLTGKALLAWSGGPHVEHLATQPKRTFTLPFERWLHADLADWRQRSLRQLADTDLGFSASALAELDTGFEAGRVQWRSLWSLCVLGAWLALHPNDGAGLFAAS